MSWLWRTDTSSPASFEKALSKLSTQITSASLALESKRSRARRVTALWTLYTTLTYLLYTLVIALVLGPQNWTVYHYAGLIGVPIAIYGVRTAMTLLFDWRIARQQAYLNTLQKQREAKIADLKKATKYDSTQELIQKYGGAPKHTPSKQPQQGTKRKINPVQQSLRTGMAPPPTANIPGRSPAPYPTTPQRPNVPSPGSASNKSAASVQQIGSSPARVTLDEPGFAPNAFSSAPARIAYDQGPHWYDRILDVLLGEDETLAKNRLALICSSCRLVNGQASPGVRSLEEVGKWRCAACGTWNGVESETAKAIKEMTEKVNEDEKEGWDKVNPGDEADVEMENPAFPAEDLHVEGEVKEIPDSEEELGVDEDVMTREEEDENVTSSTESPEVEKRVTRSATKQNSDNMQ